MLIIWGTKVVRRESGVAACFCPVCRDVTEVTVKAVSRVGHVYYIPLGSGEHVMDELKCCRCGLVQGLESRQLRPAPKTEGDLLELAVRTGPMTEEDLTQRLELETKLAEGTLSSEERLALIAEPIVAMEYAHGLKQRQGARASFSAVLQLLMIIGIFASVIMWYTWTHPVATNAPRQFPTWELIVTGVTLLLTAVVMYRMWADRRASARGSLGLLGLALAPLRPQEHELGATLAALREEKHALAHHLSARQVLDLIDRER